MRVDYKWPQSGSRTFRFHSSHTDVSLSDTPEINTRFSDFKPVIINMRKKKKHEFKTDGNEMETVPSWHVLWAPLHSSHNLKQSMQGQWENVYCRSNTET